MGKRKLSTFERITQGKMNRKERKRLARQLYAEDPGLEVVHHNVAGIDIGNESHWVSVPPHCDAPPVREFGTWTADLLRLVEWLKSCGIQMVVMQSTGVYWIGVYDILEKAGLQVWLVNARDTKNLPGRKSDIQESQWLMKLQTYGLLRHSFRPQEEIRRVRTLWRLRERHVQEAGRSIQHMQKALTTMNVQLANAISDISGRTGLAIIRAILEGERNPYELARLRDYRIQASEEEIARSLEGNWQPDVLFELQQAVDEYDFRQRQLRECDQQLQGYLGALPSHSRAEEKEVQPPAGASEARTPLQKDLKRRTRPRKNEPDFNWETELERICGVNLKTLDGVDAMTIFTFVSELGVDMSPWRSEDHLVSWLKLAPQRQVSGGKLIKHERSPVKNRVAEALRMAASTLDRSHSYLGARFRSLRSRLGPGKTIKAMAAHLARLIYRMLKHGQAWVDRGAQEFEKRRQQRETHSLQRRAAT
ncbi:MAG TPA: IS110 family transposase, partial [Candidatus Angelobacter sp.]|nr:IS110 family transposase [Candidatus Angelobacter sp.]